MHRTFLWLLILTANTALGWDFFYPDAGLKTGLYVGGSGSFGNFDFQLEETLFQNNVDQELNFFDGDVHHIAEGGGFFVGYGLPFCSGFCTSLQFDGNWYGNEAKRTVNFADVGETFVSRLKCRHLYDLTLQPGIYVGPCLLLNFKVGVSWVGIERTSLIIEDDAPHLIDDRRTDSYHRTGYVLGAAAHVALFGRLSAFVEYNWHKFSIHKDLQTQVQVNITRVFFDSQVTRLGGSTFNFGLNYKI